MKFQEVDSGDYRIYAGAIERGVGSLFQAAVVVTKQQSSGKRVEVFRDDQVGGGYLWSCPKEALRFAIQRGHDVVMCRTGLSQRV
ncbi:hypothetical protein [Inhella crocodyli]|uniref:Uncharacterized protein n=1 Tax=Inhella crocodyli TaxID=2499851 RepID=A0A3S2UYI4_9BURK|nr:hypothetical protein [Inhella crocodyli]RVT88270.1 hypothetical protein EOD73_04540 [Inhella crocodyli]